MSREAPVGRTRARVLIVDDDADVVRALAILFGLEDYEVVTARDGVEALELARQAPCDIVITDFIMPRMDGAELARRLREDPATRATPIVLVSGYPQAPGRDGALFDGFLQKPVDFAEHLSVVARLLRGEDG